jgi:hypothetical protein
LKTLLEFAPAEGSFSPTVVDGTLRAPSDSLLGVFDVKVEAYQQEKAHARQ